MNIELCVTKDSRLESSSYREIVQQYFQELAALLPMVYAALSSDDLSQIHIIVVDGSDSGRSATTSDASDRLRYRIKLVPENEVSLAEIIAHELCHVVQFYQGRMKELSGRDGVLDWEGEIYEYRGRPYRDCPWEQEAMLNANVLHSKLLEERSCS